jgi:hypothetical protein
MKLRWKEQFQHQMVVLFNGERFEGAWVAGGAVRGFVLNEHYNDIDVFFKSQAVFDRVKNFLCARGGKIRRQRPEVTEIDFQGIIVQLCSYRWFESAQDVINDFDFTICRFAMDFRWKVLYSQVDYDDAINMRLRPFLLKYPIVVFRRIDKFINKGYAPCEGFWQQVITQLKAIENTYDQYQVEKR